MTTAGSTAFVPGHVTAFFSAHQDADPAVAGSRGAGIVLTAGVETTVIPRAASGDTPFDAAQPTITLNGDPTTFEVVADVLEALDVAPETARVTLETDLPVGAGFGVSGAAALGTALAATAAFDLGRSSNDLVRIAHVAEVRRGTGLGDVVAQARGGVPIRVEPGTPEYGELDGIPARARVEYVSFGELSTEGVLADDTSTLSVAGEQALAELRHDPRLSTLMSVSRAFAVRADLLVPAVAAAIDAVDAAGGSAAMAMLGRTAFALGTGLTDAGYDPSVCRIDPTGARLGADAAECGDSAADSAVGATDVDPDAVG